MSARELPPSEREAVDAFFDGDADLYDAFRSACAEQFVHDIVEGDRASHEVDTEALRRLVHSLKSVLLTLGHPDLSALAREAEHLAKGQEHGPAVVLWSELRVALVSRFGLPG